MTDATDDFQNSRSQWQQEQARLFQAVKNAATETAKVLKARGINEIEFDYDGSGDEGFMQDCRCYGIGKVSKKERQRLEDLVFKILPGGWELNEGSYGTIFFDLKAGEVWLEQNWYERSEEELEYARLPYAEGGIVLVLQLDLDS